MSAQPVVDVSHRAGGPSPATPSLLDAVRDLRRDVQRTRYPLEIPGAAEARGLRRTVLAQLADHLLPRLEGLSVPAVVVAAGSTGAGKSTLVNSLLGAEVSPAGVLRPTTRQPVLAHHPADADLLAEHPVLGVVDVVAHDGVPRGLALLDAPDLDSVLATNRETAHRLMQAADLWLFVTTAARYGDALPWRVLEAATRRGASVAMVLNRVPPGALTTVRADLLGSLRERGMDGVPLFVVPDAGPHEGLLDADAVAPVRRWLATVAGPDAARSVILRTLRGSLASLHDRTSTLADSVQVQVEAAATLRGEVAAALLEPASLVERSVASGAALDATVRTAWADLTGSGPLGRRAGRFGRLGRTRRAVRRRDSALAELADDLRAAATAFLVAAAGDAQVALQERLAAADAPVGAAALVSGWPSQEHLAARTDDAARAAAAWVASGEAAVRTLTGPGEPARARRASRAVAALGAGGLATVALAAAAGLDAAGDHLDAALGPDAGALVDPLRADLVRLGRAAVAREGESLDELLTVPDLAQDAAARLRRRLAVLEGLT